MPRSSVSRSTQKRKPTPRSYPAPPAREVFHTSRGTSVTAPSKRSHLVRDEDYEQVPAAAPASLGADLDILASQVSNLESSVADLTRKMSPVLDTAWCSRPAKENDDIRAQGASEYIDRVQIMQLRIVALTNLLEEVRANLHI